MSINLPSAFVTAFDSEVKLAYQGSDTIGDTVTRRDNIEGSSYQFQSMGEMVTQVHSPQTDITPADVSHNNQTATLTDYRVGDYTDRFQDDKARIDERQELATNIGNALGRRMDQENYDTMNGGSYSGDRSIGTSVGGNAAFNTTKIRQAKYHFDNIEAATEDRCFVVTPKAMQQLLGTTSPTSSDYNTIRALVQGEINTWLGFEFKTLSTGRSEGGIEVNSNTANNYAYHKPSIGCATGTGPDTLMSFHEEKYSWLTQGVLSIGCVIRDQEGIVQVQTDESVDVTQGTQA